MKASEARILLPFCYHFWHTLVRLGTKVGESILKFTSLKWKKKQGFAQFCCLFEFAAAESRYRYQFQKPLQNIVRPLTCDGERAHANGAREKIRVRFRFYLQT